MLNYFVTHCPHNVIIIILILMCTASSIRLVDGAKSPSFHSGRVEVFINGQWGTVCDDSWDSNAARVVCRQLGYTSGTAYGGAVYGQGSGRIWLDNLNCTGSEDSLLNCGHRGIGRHSCSHGEDASVVCYRGEYPCSSCNLANYIIYVYSVYHTCGQTLSQSTMVVLD